MIEERKFIGEYLVSKGIIDKKKLKAAMDEQARSGSGKIGEILVRLGYVKEEEIARALSEQLGFAYMDISGYEADPAVVAIVPFQVAKRLEAIPLFKVGNTVTVAMANPLDVDAIDVLNSYAEGLRVKPIISTSSSIKAAIDKYYDNRQKSDIRGKDQPADDPSALVKEAAQVPVVKLVNKIIEDAIGLGASDIHIEPQDKSVYSRFRIDGILQDPLEIDKKLQLAVISRIKIMAGMDIAQSRLPQDGRIEMKASNRDIDLRIATFPTIYGEHVAVRILDKSRGILKLEEIGFNSDTLTKFKETIRRPYGIVLVTGPTGSGKTTTLYSALNVINDRRKNIVTLEDPVEYTIPGVHQSQVNVKAGLTFATGLRSIVRLDPDIIMIGEIRDKETADIAVHASLTGHLVFSTLHTNDSASAATRLIDIGVEPYLAASSLAGVLAQRLVRKLCANCKKERKPGKDELESLGLSSKAILGAGSLYEPSGCDKCHNTGYLGRTGIFEFLAPDEEMRSLISKKTAAYELKEAAIRTGMKTLRDDGLAKVREGVTSLSEILRVTEEA